MDKELKDILDCLMKYTSDGDSVQDARYLEIIQTNVAMYFKRVLPQPPVSGLLPLSEEKKLELILRKYHGHTKEQWQNELVKEYPYCEIPYLVEMVWKEAQGSGQLPLRVGNSKKMHEAERIVSDFIAQFNKPPTYKYVAEVLGIAPSAAFARLRNYRHKMKTKMKFHKTKDGKKIKLADLETSHLENILKWIERKAKEGFTVRMGGGSCAEDIWYDEETYYGEEAKSILNFSDYKAELERRVSTCPNVKGFIG